MERINFYFDNIPEIKLKKDTIRNLINRIAADEKFGVGRIDIIFCADEDLYDINKKFLKHNYYTDIITFNYNKNDLLIGELYISVERVKENADKFSVKFIHEILRVIIHGILHLVGYKDKTKIEKQEMRDREDEIISSSEIENMF